MEKQRSETSSTWLISFLVKAITIMYVILSLSLVQSWLMSEPERYLKEVPYPYSLHVLRPLNGWMQGFSWLDHIQRPKHGKKEGFVTSCLCLLSPKTGYTGYTSVWTPALVMVSAALMATASKQCVSSWVLRGRKDHLAGLVPTLVSFRDFSWLFKPSPDLVNYVIDPLFQPESNVEDLAHHLAGIRLYTDCW